MRKPCCTVGYGGSGWFIEWLPKGYGPGPDDRIICVFPDQPEWEGYGFSEGNRPPLIEKVCQTITDFMEQQPDENPAVKEPGKSPSG